jgi:predicted DNA-binding transcriptional regulator AlpA
VEKSYYLHRLVAVAFLANPQGKPQVNHLSGEKRNNSVMNLSWATRKENAAHAASMGLIVHGERHHSAKLTSGQVAQIRSEMAGEKGHKRASKVRELAARYGVSPSTIYRVVSGQTWKQSLPNQQHEAVKSSGGQPGRSGEVHSCGGAAIVPLVDRQLGEGASV